MAVCNERQDGRWCFLWSLVALTLLCTTLLTPQVAASSTKRVKRSAEGGDTSAAIVVTQHGAPKLMTDPGDPKEKAKEEDILEDTEDEDDEDDDEQQDDPNVDIDVKRVKRFADREKKVWPKGIVPYVFMDNLGDHYLREAKAAIARYEKYTCIRFVPWVANVTMHQYGLPDESHVNIEKRGDSYHEFYCKAYQGNLHYASGQYNSCCNRTSCMHELGHSIGIVHEHQHPLRGDYMEVQRDLLSDYMRPYYRVYYLPPLKDVTVMQPYDMSSRMHYPGSKFRSLYEELAPLFGTDNMFHLYGDVTLYSKCAEHRCSDFTGQCHNEGFLTMVDDQCSCFCPPGLDSSTGCATTISQVDTSPTWPDAAFAMFSPLSGCPGSSVFDTGSWQHEGAGDNRKSDDFRLAGSYQSDVFRYSFCVKGQTSGTPATWESGRYCILRAGGTCPGGFETGYIQFDDAAGSTGQAQGQLPDGVFVDGSDTRMEFCCRDDGFVTTPLTSLPNTQAFTLLQTPLGDACQDVSGMRWTEEYMWFDSLSGTPSMGGSHPRVSNTFKLYFCHYEPLNFDCGGIITLTASNPQVTITSPNYPLAYDTNMECNWLIKAEDPSSKILLNFEDFKLTSVTEDCQDTLEIRYNMPGQGGLRYCGDGIGRTIRSIRDTVMLTLRADHNKVTSDVGFNVTATLNPADESCYEPSSKGVHYRGLKNYTRGMKPCLAWRDATTCRYHAMHPRDSAKGLDDNYCRNPDNTAMPWCYTTPDCHRDYCDVCNVERMYDRSAVCNQGKCGESEGVIVKEGCAGTCGLQHPPAPVRDTHCSQPEVPADASMVDPQSFTSPVPVGSTVSLRCTSGSETFNLTCLSDGTWTQAGFVCGACSDGWSFYEGRCYRYFPLQKTFFEARDICGSYNGVVAPMKNTQEMEFVSSLRMHLWKMWIGATDEDKDGEWIWEDGTAVTWTHWDEDEPGAPGSKDCVVAQMEGAGNGWSDSRCRSYRFPFVCTYNVSERSVCVDRRQDCLTTLTTTSPGMCSENLAYANQLCAYTCGVCQADATPPCDVPTSTSDVIVVSPQAGGSVARGQEVRYACAAELVLSSGQLTRVCGADGNLIGSEPVCKHPDFLIQDSNDVFLIPREYGTWKYYVYVGVGSRLVITRRGVIKQWKFYSDQQGYAFFQVWRPQGPDFSMSFVGQNQVMSSGTGEQTADVARADWIQVQPGDALALYESSKSARAYVPFDNCESGGLEGVRTSGGTSYPDFAPSENVTFTSESCREFSFKAVIYPVDSFPAHPDVATSHVGLISRSYVAYYAYLGDSPNFRIPVSGRVKEWQFFVKYGGVGAFQVWRKQFDLGEGTFQLISTLKVNITSDEERLYTMEVPEAERVAVQEGDIIGIMYDPDMRLGVPEYRCKTGYTDSNNLYRLKYVSPDTAQIGTNYIFSKQEGDCLVFSFRAIIEQDVETTEAPSEATTEATTEPTTEATTEAPTTAPTDVLTSDTALVDRTNIPGAGRAFLGNSTAFRVPVTGSVKEWQFFSGSSGTGHFQIWRPTDEYGKFEFIGQNEYNQTSGEAGIYTYPVPVGERISVHAGDLVAFWYGQDRLGLPFSFCSGEHELETYNNVAKLTPSGGLVAGTVYTFQYNSGKYACRVFSYRAVIEPSP